MVHHMGLPDDVLTPEEKELFLTFPEINQLELVNRQLLDNVILTKLNH